MGYLNLKKSYQEVLDEASKAISGLSNYAGIVVAPKFQKKLKHIDQKLIFGLKVIHIRHVGWLILK